MLVNYKSDDSMTFGGNPIHTLNIKMSLKEIAMILEGKKVFTLETIGHGSNEPVEIRVELDANT